MLRHALSVICLAILPTLAAAAPKDMTVYGRAPLGAFGIDTLEHVEGAAKLGMTLVYSYSADSAKKQLDPNDPMGRAVAEAQDAGHVSLVRPLHPGTPCPRDRPDRHDDPGRRRKGGFRDLFPGIRLSDDRGRAHRVRQSHGRRL